MSNVSFLPFSFYFKFSNIADLVPPALLGVLTKKSLGPKASEFARPRPHGYLQIVSSVESKICDLNQRTHIFVYNLRRTGSASVIIYPLKQDNKTVLSPIRVWVNSCQLVSVES